MDNPIIGNKYAVEFDYYTNIEAVCVGIHPAGKGAIFEMCENGRLLIIDFNRCKPFKTVKERKTEKYAAILSAHLKEYDAALIDALIEAENDGIY